MNTKASSDLRDGDKLPHEVRLLSFHLSELIDYDQEMRKRFFGLMILVHRSVGINFIDSILIKEHLSSGDLTVDRYHRPVHLVAGQVRYGADQMRKTCKKVSHAAALVVDNEESDIFRAVGYGHG